MEPSSWRERLAIAVLREAISAEATPIWIRSARGCTREEDDKGKDIAVTTDAGDLFLQVLASDKSIKEWLRRHGHRERIGLVQVGKEDEAGALLERMVEALTKVRNQVLVLDFSRASGEAICDVCEQLYRKHPRDKRPEALGYDGTPILRVLCDGSRVKL